MHARSSVLESGEMDWPGPHVACGLHAVAWCAASSWYVPGPHAPHVRSAFFVAGVITRCPFLQVDTGWHSRGDVPVGAFDSNSLSVHSPTRTQLLSVDDVGAVFSNWLAATSQTRHAEHVVAEVHGPGVANCPSGHASQAKPLVVPLQLPFLKVPLGQSTLLQVEHTVLAAPEQPPLLYWPDAHAAQDEHAVSDVPEHPPLLYCPEVQVAHAEQAVSEDPVQPLLLNFLDVQLVQILHEKPLVTPEQLPTRYELAAQFRLPHGLQVKPLLVPEQVPALYWLDWQVPLLHAEHAVSDVPKQPPLLYWPDAHMAHVAHVVSEVAAQPPLLN